MTKCESITTTGKFFKKTSTNTTKESKENKYIKNDNENEASC